MSEKSIKLLNQAAAEELSAVHQYLYFHFHCEDQGYEILAQLFKRTSIEEMGHIEALADRIIFLGGDVDMVASAGVERIHDVREMLELAAKMESDSAAQYNKWANECSANEDASSKKVFEDLIVDEERHFDQYDMEMRSIDKFGDRYLALQSIERSKGLTAAEEGE
jgi:bacterioferritin